MVKCAELNCLVDITFDYTPGDPGCHTMSNGDPGEPGDPAYLTINNVMLKGIDIAPALREDVLDKLEATALKEFQ